MNRRSFPKNLGSEGKATTTLDTYIRSIKSRRILITVQSCNTYYCTEQCYLSPCRAVLLITVQGSVTFYRTQRSALPVSRVASANQNVPQKYSAQKAERVAAMFASQVKVLQQSARYITTSKNGHPCPCQNCSQWPPAEKPGEGSLLNRPSCPPDDPIG